MHLTPISLPFLSRIRSYSSRLISVISDRYSRYGQASCFYHHRSRDGENRERENRSRPLEQARFFLFLPLKENDLSVPRFSIFSTRYSDSSLPPLFLLFRLEHGARWCRTIKERRTGVYPGGIRENGLIIIMAGVVAPACFRLGGRVCSRWIDQQPLSIHAPRYLIPVGMIFSSSNPLSS